MTVFAALLDALVRAGFATLAWALAAAAALALYAAWLAASTLRHHRNAARATARIAAATAAALATGIPGKTRLIAELHRPALTDEELQAMYDAPAAGEDHDR